MAITLTESELEAAINGKAGVAARLLPVVTELVQRFAPDAPDSIQNEAAIRTAGWLADMTPNLNIKTGSITIRKTRFKGELSALQHSGAAGLLSSWRVRRGSLA